MPRIRTAAGWQTRWCLRARRGATSSMQRESLMTQDHLPIESLPYLSGNLTKNQDKGDTEGNTDGSIPTMQMREVKKRQKGTPYMDKINSHMPLLDAMQMGLRKAFRATFYY